MPPTSASSRPLSHQRRLAYKPALLPPQAGDHLEYPFRRGIRYGMATLDAHATLVYILDIKYIVRGMRWVIGMPDGDDTVGAVTVEGQLHGHFQGYWVDVKQVLCRRVRER